MFGVHRAGQPSAEILETSATEIPRARSARAHSLAMSSQSIAPTRPAKVPVTAVPSGFLQRQCSCGEHTGGGACDGCRNKTMMLQRYSAGVGESPLPPPIVDEVIRSPGEPLDPATRSVMETRFGHDFAGVRVHSDLKAGASAEAVGARAYTVGRHIAFAPGQYQPHTPTGGHLLRHELAHTLQQSQGATGNGGTALRIGSPSDPLETEAEA